MAVSPEGAAARLFADLSREFWEETQRAVPAVLSGETA